MKWRFLGPLTKVKVYQACTLKCTLLQGLWHFTSITLGQGQSAPMSWSGSIDLYQFYYGALWSHTVLTCSCFTMITICFAHSKPLLKDWLVKKEMLVSQAKPLSSSSCGLQSGGAAIMRYTGSPEVQTQLTGNETFKIYKDSNHGDGVTHVRYSHD